MTSDRGSQFISGLWTSLSQLLGTQLVKTTAYHPQSNGFIERLHRTLKASLKARLTGPDWLDELPWVMLGIRSIPKEDIGASPAEMVFGSTVTVPGDFLPQSSTMSVPEHLKSLRQQVETLRPVPTSAHGVKDVKLNVPKALMDAKFVYIRRDGKSTPLQPPYDGPFKVLEAGPKAFKLQLGDRTDTVSIDRLKLAITEGDVEVALPPRRGRPPNPFPGQLKNTQSNPVQSQKSAAENKPSYAEITSRSGRTIKPPTRLMY